VGIGSNCKTVTPKNDCDTLGHRISAKLVFSHGLDGPSDSSQVLPTDGRGVIRPRGGDVCVDWIMPVGCGAKVESFGPFAHFISGSNAVDHFWLFFSLQDTERLLFV